MIIVETPFAPQKGQTTPNYNDAVLSTLGCVFSRFPKNSHENVIVGENIVYAQAACHQILKQGRVPFASHLFYTQMLNDEIAEERQLGIEAGLTLAKSAEETAVFIDYGISRGMLYGIENAINAQRPISFHSLLGLEDKLEPHRQVPFKDTLALLEKHFPTMDFATQFQPLLFQEAYINNSQLCLRNIIDYIEFFNDFF